MADAHAQVKLLHDSGFCLRDARVIRRLNEGTVIVCEADGTAYEAEAIIVYTVIRKIELQTPTAPEPKAAAASA